MTKFLYILDDTISSLFSYVPKLSNFILIVIPYNSADDDNVNAASTIPFAAAVKVTTVADAVGIVVAFAVELDPTAAVQLDSVEFDIVVLAAVGIALISSDL
jgi:hypothetical protein